MDQLKKYLHQHRDELDSDVPDDAVWQKIRESASPTLAKKSAVKKMWPYAAAACMLLCVAIGALLPGTEILVHTKNLPGISAPTATDVRPRSGTLPAPHKKTDSGNSYVKTGPHKKTKVPGKSKPDADSALRIVKEVEQNYAELVDRELKRLRLTPVYAESPDYFSAFQQQYKQIGSDEAVIRNDIQQEGLNDELLQQLININQQKLNVLKDLQAEIEKLNRKVQPPQDFQAGSRSFYLTI